MNDSPLPRCFATHQAVAPNRCETCSMAEACFEVVLKSDLQPVVQCVEKMDRILRGEKEI